MVSDGEIALCGDRCTAPATRRQREGTLVVLRHGSFHQQISAGCPAGRVLQSRFTRRHAERATEHAWLSPQLHCPVLRGTSDVSSPNVPCTSGVRMQACTSPLKGPGGAIFCTFPPFVPAPRHSLCLVICILLHQVFQKPLRGPRRGLHTDS